MTTSVVVPIRSCTTKMDDIFMWIWWSCTLALCAWKIGEALLRPHRMLEWPFLAAAMWSYFYVYMAYNAKRMMPEYLGNGSTNIGQLMPLLCLAAIIVGWALGTRPPAYPVIEKRPYPYFRFWLVGMFFTAVGTAGAYSVMHALNSGALTGDNMRDASGYWILLFYVGYPGLAMTLWAVFKMDSDKRKYLGLITILALIVFMFPHIISARRGPLFPAIMILLLVPPLTLRRNPNRWIFCGVLALVGAVMLIFLQVRVTIYNGGTWTEAAQRLDLSAAMTDKVDHPEDNEYIISCQLISTIYQNGKYEYGTTYLNLLGHWIPRFIWKDKPGLGEGYYPSEEIFDDMESVTGFRLLGFGAAEGGVADTFVQFGIFCPLFWLGLSWALGMVYLRARIQNNPRWLFCYVGCICASHWLVSQAFAAAFVPCMFFQAVPVLAFAAFDSAHRRTGSAKRDVLLTAPVRALRS